MKSMRRVWALFTVSALLSSVNAHALEPGEVFVVLKEASAKRVAVRESMAGIAVTGLAALDQLHQRYEVSEVIDLKAVVRAPEYLSPQNRRTVVLSIDPDEKEKVHALIDHLNDLDEVEAAHYVPYERTALTPDDPHWGAQRRMR